MDKNLILAKLVTKKVQNYSYLILFFLAFSFFVAFLIEPNLATILNLRKELRELTELDSAYNNVIAQILMLQSLFEKNRDRMYLLEDALPAQPHVARVIDNLAQSASASGIVMKKVEINQIALRSQTANKNLKAYVVNIDTDSEFEPIRKFMYDFLQQRRLKMVKSLSIVRDVNALAVSSNSAKIKIKMEVEDYYL